MGIVARKKSRGRPKEKQASETKKGFCANNAPYATARGVPYFAMGEKNIGKGEGNAKTGRRGKKKLEKLNHPSRRWKGGAEKKGFGLPK